MNITSTSINSKLDSSLSIKSKEGLRYSFDKSMAPKNNIFDLKIKKRKRYS
jgi:hypothetical protein